MNRSTTESFGGEYIERARRRIPADSRYTNDTGVAAELQAMAQTLAETVETNIALGYYGPLEYRGHKWVGELSEAFIEVWRPDSHDRFDLIQDGFELAHEYLPVTLNLKISEFLKKKKTEIAAAFGDI
ncbi:hypothetical protein POJ06DRAFT_272152 [Lipomyces tetrasporus]|uniref:Uncharacterized protein n=1 Tax=Lipomyces tetrasporus TaxID=54092 RepID=A0AAD7VVE1_9ASCO|nr:uncharacterized protein POJ06DRAFT_272152 [Lipomyces tetrasporus]KAJ8103418.1 hypothetical protein POJ06DRAFT_272152 [Lipomyces tetrasporus]